MPNCFWSPFRHLQSRPTHPNWLCIATKSNRRDTLYTVHNQLNVTLIDTHTQSVRTCKSPVAPNKKDSQCVKRKLGRFRRALAAGIRSAHHVKQDARSTQLQTRDSKTNLFRDSKPRHWQRLNPNSHKILRTHSDTVGQIGDKPDGSNRRRRSLDLEGDPIKP